MNCLRAFAMAGGGVGSLGSYFDKINWRALLWEGVVVMNL
jgi:hypothetical protein